MLNAILNQVLSNTGKIKINTYFFSDLFHVIVRLNYKFGLIRLSDVSSFLVV